MSSFSRYCDGSSSSPSEHCFLLGFQPSPDVHGIPTANARKNQAVSRERSLLSELIKAAGSESEGDHLYSDASTEYPGMSTECDMDDSAMDGNEYAEDSGSGERLGWPSCRARPIAIVQDSAMAQRLQKECFRRMFAALEEAEMRRARTYQAQACGRQ